jgi:rubredoxin
MEHKTYQCSVCEYQHDEETDVLWENLTEYWTCPNCGAAKENYVEVTF